MEIEEILHQLGLRKEQAKIYLSLLDNGAMTVSGISQATGLHRPRVYQVVPELRNQGLVAVSPHGKQKRYVAESPEKLKMLISNMTNAFEQALPDLEMMFRKQSGRPKVKFFQGKQGIGNVFLDIVTTLKRGEIFYRYTGHNDIERAERYLPKEYKKIRDQKGLERYVISNPVAAEHAKNKLGREIKVMPKEFDLFDYELTMHIYGPKISFIDFNTETAIVIENERIASFQRKLFQFIYKTL